MQPGSTSRRVAELDGLRGIAICLVIASHIFAPVDLLRPIAGMAWSGVDLFFVLSGFFLGGILLDHRGGRNFFRTFYTRRICRIFPLYFIMFGLFWLAWQFPQPGFPPWVSIFQAGHLIPIWSYATFTNNFFVAYNQQPDPHFMSSTWSLAVEEQFYLVLPWLIYLARKKLPWVLLSGILLAPVCRLLFLHLAGNVEAAYVLLPCRMDSLFLGVLGAWCDRSPAVLAKLRQLTFQKLVFGTALGATLLAIFCPRANDYFMAAFGYTWLGFFYLSLVLWVRHQKSTWFAKACRSSFLRFMGKVSFFIYLTHLPTIDLALSIFVGEIGPQSGVPFEAVAVATLSIGFLLVLADVSWRLLEQPIIEFGRRRGYE